MSRWPSPRPGCKRVRCTPSRPTARRNTKVDALPAKALAAYAELRVVLETAPWSGRPYHRGNPQGAVRARSFGTHGMVVYLILEDQRRVDVLLVQWVG